MNEYDTKKIFSKNLSRVLSENGMTQAELASEMGVAASSVSAWCNGDKMPRMDKIEWISKKFNISKSELLEENLMQLVPPEQRTRGMTEEEREAYYRDLHKKEPPEMIGGLTEEEIEYIRWFREEASEKEKALVRTLIKGEEK